MEKCQEYIRGKLKKRYYSDLIPRTVRTVKVDKEFWNPVLLLNEIFQQRL